MAHNSMSDLVAGKTITCPACGSLMALDHPGTYRLVLSEGARHCYDSWIQAYRTMLGKLESHLAHINRVGVGERGKEIPSIPNEEKTFADAEKGSYGSDGAAGVTRFQNEIIDFFCWQSELLAEFPPHGGPHGRTLGNAELNNLLAAMEPPSAMGPLVSLILEQEDVAAWIDSIGTSDLGALKRDLPKNVDLTHDEERPDDQKNPMRSLAQCAAEVAPHLTMYMISAMRDLLSRLTEPADPAYPGLKERINLVARAMYMIVILRGHRDYDAEKRTSGLIKFQMPYKLPRFTEVSSFDTLVNSVVTMDRLADELGLSKGFVDAVKKGSEAAAFDFLKKGEITKVANFVCVGDPADTISVVVKGSSPTGDTSLPAFSNPEKKMRRAICGWSPKALDSHAIVLLGGPATSKTSVLVSGMTSLEQQIHTIGASQDFDSPTDEEAFQSLFEAFWQRSEVEPTARGSRQTLKLSITDVDGKKRTHFVFTDIAGEIVADLIKDKDAGIDPAVERRLKKAEIILFFLDFSLDNALREPLVAGQKDKVKLFSPLIDHLDKARRDRVRDKARLDQVELQRGESSADVPQLRLLGALLKKLEELRQCAFPQVISGVKFILVIPKCDLFVHPDLDVAKSESEGLFFLTRVFDFLRSKKALVPSRNFPGDGFAGMITSSSGEADVDGLNGQSLFLKEVSEQTRKCLVNFGNILGNKANAELRTQMSRKIELQVVKRLEAAFGKENIFYLPVSARGGDAEPKGTSDAAGSARPAGFNQKLTEYVFLAPILLSLLNSTEYGQPRPDVR